MGIKQLYNDNLRKLPNEYGDVSVMLYKINLNKYILHVLSIKFRDKLYFSFSIPTPDFPRFYCMLGANLGLLLYGEVSVMVNEWYPFAENQNQIRIRIVTGDTFK